MLLKLGRPMDFTTVIKKQAANHSILWAFQVAKL